MEETRGGARGRWGTAIALLIAVSFLSVFYVLPLVAIPLGILLVALPGERKGRRLGAGLVILVLALGLPGGPLAAVSRGWALLVGGVLLLVSRLRPGWGVLSRALLALAVGFAASGAWAVASGAWGGFDAGMQEHYRTLAAFAAENLRTSATDSAWIEEFREAMGRVAHVQWTLFPAVLGLQSLAAMGLASWWVARICRQEGAPFELRPLREFRFNDQMVWVLVAGLLLVVFPLGALATRLGYNALFFMGGLYALRGVGVFLFLAGGAPTLVSILLGALAAIFLYPLVLTAALLVGLGDTWLDVRGRATLAPRA